MRAIALLLLLTASTVCGCWDLAENDQRSILGNNRFGNALTRDLAIDREGRFLVAATEHEVFAVDLRSFAITRLDASPTSRFVFGEPGEAFFATHHTLESDSTTNATSTQGTTLTRVSLSTGAITRRWTSPRYSNAMTRDPRSARVALWSFYGPDGERVTLVDPRHDAVRELTSPRTLHDVGFLPDGALALVEATERVGEDRSPSTRITFVAPDLTSDSLTVPNCASRLNISPDGRLGMLAPTFCGLDPVSVIDLPRRRFVENLPGFGPVVFSPDGEWALAFGRKADLESFGIESETAFSLLFISTADLSIEVLDLGAELPTYTVTPDGEVVLIYSIFEQSSWDSIVLVDVSTRSIRFADGPDVDLSEFVMTSDGALVYLIDGGLFRLDVASGQLDFVRVPCGGPNQPSRCNPQLVNLLPDDETLVLGWRADPELAFFDIPSHRLMRTLVLPQRRDTPPPQAL